MRPVWFKISNRSQIKAIKEKPNGFGKGNRQYFLSLLSFEFGSLNCARQVYVNATSYVYSSYKPSDKARS